MTSGSPHATKKYQNPLRFAAQLPTDFLPCGAVLERMASRAPSRDAAAAAGDPDAGGESVPCARVPRVMPVRSLTPRAHPLWPAGSVEPPPRKPLPTEKLQLRVRITGKSAMPCVLACAVTPSLHS